MTIFIPEPHLLSSPRGRDWPFPPGACVAARAGDPPARTDVVIVGAGLAGLAVASALWHVGVRDVVLLDRDGRPAGRFFDRVDVLGQRVMRSPYEHHPGLEAYRDCELLDFVRLHWSLLTPVERREVRMAQASHRSVVPVDAFEAFCRHVATIHHVYDRTWQAEVRAVRPDAGGIVVGTDRSAVAARFAVLCLGEERLAAPRRWWRGPRRPHGVCYWDEPLPNAGGPLVVVGAGLSAAHLISNGLAANRPVHWVVRGSERYQCADVNSKFFRAEGRARFDGVPWADRMAHMQRERRASVMYEFRPLLTEAEADGRLTVYRGRAVTGVTGKPGGGPATVVLDGGTRVEGDQVVLALGTAVSTGVEVLPAALVAAREGWPDLDERTLNYRNAPEVFAVGAAAGMVLGPAARNIDGHRVATARVATTIAARLAGRPDPVLDRAGAEVSLV